MNQIEKIKEDLKNTLSEYRYEHSILVAQEAKKLACHYNVDEKKAYISGLVHDIAKEFSDEENVLWIKKYDLNNELLLPKYKKIIHADIGSVVVKEKYNLDEEICNAVLYHTTGSVNMTLLDKIVFVSDKISRKTKNKAIDEITQLAYENIDKALITLLIIQKNKLESDKKSMHPNSIKLLQNLMQKDKNIYKDNIP